MVDPRTPGGEPEGGVDAADQQVTGIEADPDVAQLEQPLDLPAGFDVGAGVRMERRFEAAVAAPGDDSLEAVSEPPESLVVETEPPVVCRFARSLLAFGGTGVGERRLRCQRLRVERVEGVEQLEQFGPAAL